MSEKQKDRLFQILTALAGFLCAFVFIAFNNKLDRTFESSIRLEEKMEKVQIEIKEFKNIQGLENENAKRRIELLENRFKLTGQ